MTMNEQLDLTIPQVRLMHIFVYIEHGYDYDDHRAKALLTYLQELVREDGIDTPMLDALLGGTLPPLNFSRYFSEVMREVNQCESADYSPTPNEIPLGEYRDALQNCFPALFPALFPEPVWQIDPARNLLVSWAMGYDRKIQDELWNASDDTCQIATVIYAYIDTCIENWPFLHQSFLSHWNHYLLTRKWPDKSEELERERNLRQSFQEINAHLAAENQAHRLAQDEHLITIIDAARAVLRVEFGQDDVEKLADALKKRIIRGNPALAPALIGKQNREYFSVNTLIPLFQDDDRIHLTNGAIHDAIRARSVPRSKLE